MSGPSKLLQLPEEILLRIFGFLYQPWYLEIEIRKNLLLEYYYEEPRVHALPSSPDRALLSTCSLTSRIARGAMLEAFIGVLKSQEEHCTTELDGLQFPATWAQLEPRIKRLCLPSTRFSIVNSKELILKFSAIKTVELFEDCDISAVVDDLAVGSNEDFVTVSDEYLQNRARRFLPVIPDDMPFSCNGGNVDLLLHVYFDFWRQHPFPPSLNVLFKIGANLSPIVIKKEWRSRMVPMPLFSGRPLA